MVSGTVISQDASELGLRWVQGDVVGLQFTVEDNDWSGSYTAQIRRSRNASAQLLGTLTVTATLNGTDTDFTLAMSALNSAAIPHGTYYWDLQQTGGVTRLWGSVEVKPQVTV